MGVSACSIGNQTRWEEDMVKEHNILLNGSKKYFRHWTLAAAAIPAILAAILFSMASPALAACTGPGAPTTTETQCLAAVQIPGNPLRSFDISWANPDRAEYYLGDRSNAGIDIIDTKKNSFITRL